MYTTPLSTLISSRSWNHHLYSDDCTVVLQQKCDNATLIIFISTTTTTTILHSRVPFRTTLSDLEWLIAKYSMTQSIARILCDTWASCTSIIVNYCSCFLSHFTVKVIVSFVCCCPWALRLQDCLTLTKTVDKFCKKFLGGVGFVQKAVD